MIAALCWAALVLAAIPAAIGCWNLAVLRTPRPEPSGEEEEVSILIPARDEAAEIGAALHAARASRGVRCEIVVMDDGSTDGTAAIVREHAAADRRVRLVAVPQERAGWVGKNRACQHGAEVARYPTLLFVDADVRLAPNAAASLIAHARREGAALVSAVPRQEMRSLGELLTVPMINLLILGYLPIARMRSTLDPSLGAACGQLVLVDAATYRTLGGHGAVRGHLHEAIHLARHVRRSGYRTDLVAGADLATCRMYGSLGESWAGFAKNAHEGMARPIVLPVWTLLLAGGHVLPFVLILTGSISAPALGAAALSLVCASPSRCARARACGPCRSTRRPC